MKKFILLTLILGLRVVGYADEGLWIPMLLQQLNEKEMQTMGLKLTAEDIYSINKSSLKDAILLFGGGCTAEFVSAKGLIFTNHHCGYSAIQQHSSLEHDYLRVGFWAKNQVDELPNPGLTASLLIRMEDVTSKILQGVKPEWTEAKRDSLIALNMKMVEKEAVKGTPYEGKVKSFYYGNEYYLFITMVFKDVRLVGAPPNNIGKFGGDTDNWMWPRHTGDFSVFRVYVDKDGKPAEYSKDNVPYQPKYVLPISMKGYEKGDFTFVYGYPGTTQEYIPSEAVALISKIDNPIRIKLRTKRLEVIDRYMNQSRQVRIQYSAKSANIANGWKKWIGENRGITRLQVIDKKEQQEKTFQMQASKEYRGLLQAYEKVYQDITPPEVAATYFNEAGNSIEVVRFARTFTNLVKISQKPDHTDADLAKAIEQTRKSAEGFFKNYYLPIDQELSPYLLTEYVTNCAPAFLPPSLAALKDKKPDMIREFSDEMFRRSFLVSEKSVNEFLNQYKAKQYKKILKDPVYAFSKELLDFYSAKIQGPLDEHRDRIDSLNRVYMKAQRELQPGRRFYPDANLTLRVAYGTVQPYQPNDAVSYQYFTTLDGIIQKEDTTIYDYIVDSRLKALYEKKDFGKYADKDGTIHTCFIANNHTSGGNSGSPVLNANGELLGLNFDRCWEGTMSDIIFDPTQCRNITLDIRYCLFVIDKVCGAGHLLNEMKLIN